MLDGFRADVLENAIAPNMKRLVEGKWQNGYRCAWSFSAQTVPDALASSAPNHSAIALGVTTAKNKVANNGQYANTDYTKYPSWLVRIANANPEARTLFMYSWKADGGLCPSPKVEFVWSRETASGQGLRNGTMRTCDRANGKELEKRFASDAAPDATLLFLDCPDHAGHGILTGEGVGFYPYSTAYLGAINECDGIIGRCLDAIAKRPTFKDEDWLMIVTSDHGGYAKTHGLKGGHATAIPLLVASRHVKQGRIPGTPHNYDVAPTVLAHFGIDWSGFDLDGKVVGGETVVDSVRPLADGRYLMVIDYRLVPARNISPTNMMRGAYMATQDVSAAIRFFKAQSDHYGIDTNAIFLLGNSAGSIASLYTVFMKDDERPAEAYLGGDLGMLDDSGLDISRGHTSRVAGVVAQWGGVSDIEVIDPDETTPVCMIHGTADKTVPYTYGTSGIYALVSPKLYGSYSIAHRMDSLGMKHYELHPFEGESHAFYFGPKYRLIPEKLDACLRIAIDFICRNLR